MNIRKECEKFINARPWLISAIGMQLYVDALIDELCDFVNKILSEQTAKIEPQGKQLLSAAYALAMDCLQSTRYHTDAEFKQEVDNILAITGIPARQST